MRLRPLLLLLCVFWLSACQTTMAPLDHATDDGEQFALAKAAFKSERYTDSFVQFQPLAERGHPGAQYVLGYQYYTGLGTAANRQQALYWIRRAAEQGHKKALKALALLTQPPLNDVAPGPIASPQD